MNEELNRKFNRYIAKILSNTSLSSAEQIYFKQQMRYLQKDITRLQDNKGIEDEKTTTHRQ